MTSPLYRCLLALILAGAPPSVGAQAPAAGETRPLPGWVVPVLRLVSATHVEPTTGVVLSRGRVLVPLDFGAVSDEIVVLDGGTDIVRNGRPARTEREFPELGLKVLAIDGLERPGAPLAAAPPDDGAVIVLAAYPPAERIEQGEPPLHRETTVRAEPGAGVPGLAPEVALPNVTGAVLDACGNLVAYSVADGVQDMAPAPGTQYRWQGALEQVRRALGLAAATALCQPVPAADAASDVQEEAPSESAPDEAPAEPEQAPDVQLEEEEPPPDLLPPLEDEAETAAVSAPATEEPIDDGSTAWWWLIAALLAFGGGLALHRLRKAGSSAPTNRAASEAEPESAAPEIPESEAVPPPADSRILLSGQFADGRPLQVSAAVNARAVNLEIGRGAAADLVIESPAVSRRHARLGYADGLTLGDLGSANGSSINGVPCLEGEVMYLEAGDVVILGDVRFTVEVVPDGGGRVDE